MNYLYPYLHMLLKVNTYVHIKKKNTYSKRFSCYNIFKIREHLPLDDEPESLLELPELLDLPAFSPF